jgi:erythromycin esterase-like protein
MIVSCRRLFRLAASVVGLAMLSQACASELQIHPIALDKPYQADDYVFLDAAVGSRGVVALGESIHVTGEMPLVRQRVVS